MKAIYPGSFDPVTYGHIDIIKRASEVFEDFTVVLMNNSRKKPLFSVDERFEMLKSVTKELNVKVDIHNGLLVQYAKAHDVKVALRGLRAVEDFEYEFEMALANKEMDTNLETIYFMTDIRYLFLSSSMVKEIAQFGGELKQWVPEFVEKKLREKFQKL
uniref:Phosphopantetheine adenylyltransferase n=1 Tax=Mesoaciditoga lauensis TaxID=1495039 RepID=A0A7V3RD99_9BACT